MSPSPPADSWISDFESLLGAPTATSSGSFSDLGLTTVASGASGGGNDGEYDGGAKRSHLFFFSAALGRSKAICCGLVGSGGRRFCFKKTSTCSAKSHSVKFSPMSDTFYLKGNDTCAHTQPCLPASLVPAEELPVIHASKHLVDEWTSILARYADSREPAVETFTKVVLKTLAKSTDKSTMDSDIMVYSPRGIRQLLEEAQENEEVLDAAQSLLSPGLIKFLKNINTFVADFDHWWKTPLSKNYALLALIKDDLLTLKQNCEHLHLMLGQPLMIGDTDFPNIWSALEYLSTLPRQGAASSPPHLGEEVNEIRAVVDELPNVLSQYVLVDDLHATLDTFNLPGIQNHLKVWEQRFSVIAAGLHQVKALVLDVQQLQTKMNNSTASTGPRSHPLLQRLSQSRPPSPSLGPASEVGADAIARLNSIELKLSQVETRLVGEGVTLGSFTFQALDDVRLWCRKNLPTHRFGLFLDGVSIFEFLAQDHANSMEVLTNLYNAQKNQFNNLYDSKVLTSCQNLFPSVFGRASSDGMDTSRTLPGLSTADKWDNNGVTGLRFQLSRELINVDTQITTAIDVAFRDQFEGAALAKEMLYRSKKFVNELSNFMSQDFSFWRAKGYDKTASWELTCCSVRRLYEDIHQVQIVARDVRDLEDANATASLVLWAAIRSHKIMEDYSRRNFYEHPSISAVISRHLAANHTKPDQTMEKRLHLVEDKLSQLTHKLDSFESRIAQVEQKNDITPQKGGRQKNRQKDKDNKEADPVPAP